MKSAVRKKKAASRETLTEAYEVRAFRDEGEQAVAAVPDEPPRLAEALRPEPGSLQAAKERIAGHGEQCVLPDDCQFGDNDLCDAEK